MKDSIVFVVFPLFVVFGDDVFGSKLQIVFCNEIQLSTTILSIEFNNLNNPYLSLLIGKGSQINGNRPTIKTLKDLS